MWGFFLFYNTGHFPASSFVPNHREGRSTLICISNLQSKRVIMLQIKFRYKFQLIKAVAFAFLFFLAATSNFAQHLDLDGYIQLLEEKNIVLQQSANQLAVSHQDTRLAKAALLPSVGADITYQRDFTKNYLYLNEEDPTGFFPDKFRTNFNNNFNASIVAEQSIYNPVGMATFKLAKLAEEQVRLTYEDLSQELIKQGAQLFWQAIFTRESLHILEDNKALAEEQWQQMRALFEQGYVSELQVYQSKSFYKRTIPQLQSAQNTYKLILNELKTLAGLSPEYLLELEGEIGLSNSELNAVIVKDTSLILNTQIKLLFQQAQIAEQQIEVAKTARHPLVKANLGYHFNAQDNAFRFDNNNKLLFGQLAIQVPILTGGYNTAQIQKAKIEQKNVLLEIQNKRLELQKELSNAKLHLQTALKKIEEEKEAIQLSEKELAIASESKKQGMITPLEVKEMRLGLTEAKLRLLNAYLDLRIAHLQIDRILGKV